MLFNVVNKRLKIHNYDQLNHLQKKVFCHDDPNFQEKVDSYGFQDYAPFFIYVNGGLLQNLTITPLTQI